MNFIASEADPLAFGGLMFRSEHHSELGCK